MISSKIEMKKPTFDVDILALNSLQYMLKEMERFDKWFNIWLEMHVTSGPQNCTELIYLDCTPESHEIEYNKLVKAYTNWHLEITIKLKELAKKC